MLLSHVVIHLFFFFEGLHHLLHYLLVVCSHCCYTLDHSLDVLKASFLLEVFDLLPDLIRYLCGRSNGMQCLRKTIALQEFSDILFRFSLKLIVLIQDVLKLILKFVLHGSHFRWNDVSKFIFNRHLSLNVIQSLL
jgi:hypothetical protein